MSARAIIAFGAVLAVGVSGIVHADVPASTELHVMLLADSLLLPPVNPSLTSNAAVTAAPAPENDRFALKLGGDAPGESFGPRLAEDRVTQFFRTGVLIGDQRDHPAKKLSVGPCEGGQLLNLRTSF